MKKRCVFLFLFSIFVVHANEQASSYYFENIKKSEQKLQQFLFNFPKGGDIHTHIDGAMYAESMIRWAADDGKCIDLSTYKILLPPCDVKAKKPLVSSIVDDEVLVNRLIDAFSIRNYKSYKLTGSEQFFSTFDRIHNVSIGREGDMLNEISQRAANQNTFYLEVMESWHMGAARDFSNTDDFAIPQKRKRGIDKIADETIAIINEAEKRRAQLQQCSNINHVNKSINQACQVTIAYIPQVIRVFTQKQVLAQTLLAIRLIERDTRFVGLTFVAPEHADSTIRNYAWQMQMIKKETANKRINISLHAGEIIKGQVTSEKFRQQLGTHVRQAIEVAGADRIGHGIDVLYDIDRKQLLKYMAKNKIAVETNLTSNDIILGLKDEQHPFTLFRKYGVPITLSTDDEGISRINLTSEYQRAVISYNLSYANIKELSRNSLIYSFQPGKSLFNVKGQFVRACRKLKKQKKTKSCTRFLSKSKKATLQYDLENRFWQFENTFKRG